MYVDTTENVIYLAGGYFWGIEALMQSIPGVIDARSGYANGTGQADADYRTVCTGKTGFRETVRVEYNPEQVSLDALLLAYFYVIDPTVANRQGNDIGSQYQTGVYYTNDKTKEAVERIADIERSRSKDFLVEIGPLVNFYPAEDYHQDYLEKNPGGYSAALPQIMKKCGIDYFMTTKISWNEFNKMPYDTFLWEGIDGTQVLTHFMPARDYGVGAKEGSAETEHFTTYNAMLNPSQIKGSWQRYSQKYLNNEVLISYGYGDGGGGPTLEMLENQRRLSRGIPGCPTTVQSHALEFFQKLERDVMGSKYLPHWVGELYLEYHRGTYTSMARNKRWNRKMEFAFENAELYRTLACAFTGLPYPKEELREGWEVLLRNQFHDILPGSSIREVYEDSAAEYRQIEALAQEKTEQALHTLADGVDGQPGDLVVFNPNGVTAPSTLTFWYSICPHKGGFDQAGMVAQSYLFNNPCVAVEKTNQGGTLPRIASWISADDPNVVVEVVKQAEDSQDVIVRLYQSLNQRSQVKLTAGFDVERAAVCTMLEQEETEAAVENNQITLSLKPFEIVTLKLVRK